MSIDQTLRLLAKARGLSVTDIATAIPRAGVATVSAWMRGDKLPGKDQLDALARTFGVAPWTMTRALRRGALAGSAKP